MDKIWKVLPVSTDYISDTGIKDFMTRVFTDVDKAISFAETCSQTYRTQFVVFESMGIAETKTTFTGIV